MNSPSGPPGRDVRGILADGVGAERLRRRHDHQLDGRKQHNKTNRTTKAAYFAINS